MWWRLVYVVGSIPILLVCAMGLSGWFFEYPIPLMAAIFVVLAAPLALVALRSTRAPRWNIIMLWTVFVLMTLRSINVFVWPVGSEGQPPISGEEFPAILATLFGILAVLLGWAAIWTKRFRALPT